MGFIGIGLLRSFGKIIKKKGGLMDKEIWMDIEGFPNYEVSDLGRIKVKEYSLNNRTFKEKLLKPQTNKRSGYIQIMLTDDNNQRKLKYLHRLVANAFLPKDDEITTVTHKDGDKTNNKASNLEYGKPNPRHKTEVDRKRFKYLIKQKLLNGAIIAVYNGFDDLIKNGYKKVSIVAASNCNYINGNKRIDVYKGYKWEVIRMKKEETNND